MGEENATYLYIAKMKTLSISAYVLIFRRGSYYALLAASGITGKFKPSRILHYARVMDGRMQTVKKPSPTPTSTPTNTPTPTSTPANTPTPTSTPTNTPSPLPTGAAVHFLQVSAGFAHTCGVTTDGSVACWGCNCHGETTAPSGSFLQVSSGDEYTCGVKTDGSVACWGDNSFGQSSPPSGSFLQVSAGTYHTCGVKTDGSVACWGDNEFGEASPPSG